MAKKAKYPHPIEGQTSLRSRVEYIDGWSENPKSARVSFYFSTVKGHDGDPGSFAYGDHRQDLSIAVYVCPKRGVYGWDVGYQGKYFVDAHEARGMAQTLTDVEKALRKFADATGQRPATFGAYVVQIARALDIETLAIERDEEARERCGYRWGVKHIRSEDGSYAVNAFIARIHDGLLKSTGYQAPVEVAS